MTAKGDWLADRGPQTGLPGLEEVRLAAAALPRGPGALHDRQCTLQQGVRLAMISWVPVEAALHRWDDVLLFRL